MLITKINDSQNTIRHYFDDKQDKWYFSIVDVIAELTDTTDARNYWKVLKNRLKTKSPELVTKCNQLKLRAKDGKYYLTDVVDSETMIDIIESIPKASARAFELLINELKKTHQKRSLIPRVVREREFILPKDKKRIIKTVCICGIH